MFDQFEKWDIDLFFAINARHNPFCDALFYWISNGLTWIPVYILIVGFLIRLYGLKTALVQVALIGLLVAFADLISVYGFKNMVGRYRPTHNILYGHTVHIVHGHKGGIFSFVSSHAVNFAVWTTVVWWLLKRKLRTKWLLTIFLIPVLVGYSRIYLGVHYPADVMCGFLIGIAMALIGILIYKKYLRTRLE